MVLSILSKLGIEFSVFVSTFHATKLLVRNWRIATLAKFMESLTQEKHNLVQMDSIKPMKDQALAAGDSKKAKRTKYFNEKKHRD